jgi:hypothetical protein
MLRCLCLSLSVVLAAAACDVQVGEKGVSVGVSGGKATDRWERTYSVEPTGRLEIINANGAIRVSTAEDSRLFVQIDRESHASSDEAARANLETLDIVEEAGGGQVRIVTRRDQSGEGARRRRAQVAANYTVRMPRGLTASFKTENGSVTLENLQGRISAATTNGAINGTSLSGSVSATTVNGGIQLGLTSVTEAMDLTVVNGGIRLELGSGVKADVVASAVNGAVSVDDQLKLSADGDAGPRAFPFVTHVTGRLNGGGPKISAQSTNGGVRIMAEGSRTRVARDR